MLLKNLCPCMLHVWSIQDSETDIGGVVGVFPVRFFAEVNHIACKESYYLIVSLL